MYGNDFSDTLGSYTQCVVSFAEGIKNGKVWINLAKTLIVDYQQGINMLRHFLYAIQCLINLLWTFETEWDGYDTNGKNT